MNGYEESRTTRRRLWLIAWLGPPAVTIPLLTFLIGWDWYFPLYAGLYAALLGIVALKTGAFDSVKRGMAPSARPDPQESDR